MSALAEQGLSSGLLSSKAKRERNSRKPPGLKPCERCKNQHLKCVYHPEASKCQRCERSGHECVKTAKKLRFRDVSASRLRDGRKQRRAPNGTRHAPVELDGTMSTGTTALLNDPDSVNFQTLTSWKPLAGNDPMNRPSRTQTEVNEIHNPHRASKTTELQAHDQSSSPTTRQQARLSASDAETSDHHFDSLGVTSSTTSPTDGDYFVRTQHIQGQSQTRSSTDQYQHIVFNSPPQGFAAGATPVNFLDDMVKSPYPKTTEDTNTYLETILLRYFRQELAPWFDICDPFHHFADVLPQSAREAGPLRSAILTISARNLSHNRVFRSHDGVVQWQGHSLPTLTEELAISYHNECIRELLQLSLNHKKLYDDTLLAAVVILRTDEEMLHEAEDKELFLRISSLFVDAQLPLHLALPHTSPQIFHPTVHADTVSSPSVQTDSDLSSSGLRQACFWTSLRQDLHAAFLKQQSVKFPLSRCEDFRQLGPATDAVWAHRMVVFCADVLEFCYGSESIDAKVQPAYTNRERWQQLRAHEESLCASLPSSFEPVYCREPERTLDEVFPSLFYLETTHVVGTTYMELARMLLGWFNPAIPKLGHGSQRATKVVLASNRKVLFRLCGIALSNSSICPPSLVNAALGIGLFGEYFEDSAERKALVSVLSLMIQRYNYYPSAQIASLLHQSWLADDNEKVSSMSITDMDLQ